MNVGITFDLRDEYLAEGYGQEETAEFDSIETIDAITDALSSLGCHCVRIGHIQALTLRLAQRERWDMVFNLAEGLHGFGREAQVPALLDAFRIPYTFSDPLVLALALHKGLTKRVIRDLGIATADFAIVECEADIDRVTLALPLFVKPVAEGTSKGISADSKIHTRGGLVTRCRELLNKYRQPVLVERFLSGREFTVGIVGTGSRARAVGTMEVLLGGDADAEIYTYMNKAAYETRVHYRLADDDIARQAADVSLRAWRGLGCRDAGRVDVRCDDRGQVHFQEINPLAGLNPQHSDLPILCSLSGIGYTELIRMILESARERSHQPAPRGGASARPWPGSL